MTCIVAVATDKNVVMGAERALSDKEIIIALRRPKIAFNNGYLIGYAGSLGVGQLLQMIELPPVGKDSEKSIRLSVVKAYKRALEDYGAPMVEEIQTDLIIAHKASLYEFGTQDWSVAEVEYTAVGSGNAFALGSLHSTSHYTNSEKRVRRALEAAISLSPTCMGPIDILAT